MDFTIKSHKLLFWRLGNMNSVKQEHFWKGDADTHKPPTSRGIWCFPYPFHDYFFVYHQWEGKLPKKFRKEIGVSSDKYLERFDKMTDEESDRYHREREDALKKVKKLYRPSKFWYDGKFYSHISVHGTVDGGRWFLWECPSEWVKVARKHIYHWERFEDGLTRFQYSKDHFEIFIPNYK